jgi:NTP pyrophosphatase (non-canonical NTP hydrolase)
MRLNEYQSLAARTDRRPEKTDEGLLIPMLGIAGEIGALLAEYKRQIRDGVVPVNFKAHLCEELGDILWYTSNLALKLELDLEEVATANLQKTSDRWLEDKTSPEFFDSGFPLGEQLPRHFEVHFGYADADGRSKIVVTDERGEPVGNPLSDNAFEGDGYRFHDAYHFTFAAMLGWSPVTRRNFKRKRKSNPAVDEVEDGGRGWVIEEGIAALSFAYAMENDCFTRTDHVDESLLKAVRTLTATVEVKLRSSREWASAIVTASRLWRKLNDNDGGGLRGNLEQRSIEYLSAGERPRLGT